MTATTRSIRISLLLLASLVACGTGCTSVISSAYLRNAFWEGTEHAAQTAKADEAENAPNPEDEAALVAADEDRRAAAIEEAVSRLSRLGALDEATQTTLIETLQRTSQEDWPAVVEAFAESLARSDDLPTTASSAPITPEPHVVAKADLDAALLSSAAASPPLPLEPEPAAAPEPTEVVKPEPIEPQPESTVTPVAVPEPATPEALPPVVVDASADSDHAEPAAPFAIRNACFATRVQAWGVVDRFVADEFQQGQDVIVYFELDGLSAGTSPAGHTTCIDTALRLTTADGTTLHDWSFEPIAETCRSRRHDYFARYVVRIPESKVAGDCQVEIVVTDTLSGSVAQASLPLAVAASGDRPAGP